MRHIFRMINILFLSLSACAQHAGSADGLSTIHPTIYYKPSVSGDKDQCSSSTLRDVLDADGKVLVTLCDDDYKDCLLQGSCFVIEKNRIRSINIGAKVDGSYRFTDNTQKRCPFGVGVDNICLDPFYSVAADLTYYRPGTVIYVPRMNHLPLPDGSLHDGFFIVRDTGDAIKGRQRFDFFTGTINYTNKANTFAKVGLSDQKNGFEFRLATPAEAAAALQKRRFPLIP